MNQRYKEIIDTITQNIRLTFELRSSGKHDEANRLLIDAKATFHDLLCSFDENEKRTSIYNKLTEQYRHCFGSVYDHSQASKTYAELSSESENMNDESSYEELRRLKLTDNETDTAERLQQSAANLFGIGKDKMTDSERHDILVNLGANIIAELDTTPDDEKTQDDPPFDYSDYFGVRANRKKNIVEAFTPRYSKAENDNDEFQVRRRGY